MDDQPTTYSAKQNQPIARTICIFNLRGGVGKTTLATNLAVAIAQLKKCEVGLIDIALDTLHCSLMLDLKPDAYLSGMSEIPTNLFDHNSFNRLYCKHATGVHLVAAAENPKDAELVTPEMMELSWQFMAPTFPYIIIDAGSNFNDVSLAAIDRSDAIILVFSPELASVKSTSDVVDILTEIGVPDNKITAVANWVFPANQLLFQRVKSIIRVAILGVIPNDSTAFGKSINTGRPLILDDPLSDAAEAIRSLAAAYSEIPVIGK